MRRRNHVKFVSYIGKCPKTGKAQFQDQGKASRARRRSGGGGSVYRCVHCGLWHVTSEGRLDD